MKLTDLNPSFYDATGGRTGVGIYFDCPCGGICKAQPHIPFTNPLDGGEQVNKKHPAWERTGDTFENLTLKPSLLRLDGCKWHGFLTNGEFKSV